MCIEGNEKAEQNAHKSIGSAGLTHGSPPNQNEIAEAPKNSVQLVKPLILRSEASRRVTVERPTPFETSRLRLDSSGTRAMKPMNNSG